MLMKNNLPLTNTLAPADQAAVAEAVEAAWKEKTAVYPIGGGTRLDYGLQPTLQGIGLSLEKLNRLVDYSADDMTITVEAGMTMADIAKTLADRRQCLPVDVAQPDRATIGGTMAINPSGPRQLAFGTLRDNVLGFTAVDGQGRMFSGGGRVLKNAAGYNMCRLMTGSLGTLGIVTQITLMVRPMPETTALTVCDLSGLDTAEKLLVYLMQSPLQPIAVELALGPKRRENPALGPMTDGNMLRLFVGFEGSAVEVQWKLDTLRDKLLAEGVTSLLTVTDASAKPLWDWLVDFPADVQISVRPSAVTKTIGSLLSIDPDCSIQAHAGTGILQVMFSPAKISGFSQNENLSEKPTADGQDSAEDTKCGPFALFLRRKLRPLADATAAKLVVLKYPEAETLTRHDVWGPSSNGIVVMQSLKDRFDPAGILNPGRFVFDRP
jgi:glycolate oxidase FAD binding subunit